MATWLRGILASVWSEPHLLEPIPLDWVAGTKAEINELDGEAYYDVLGLAGAVYGLAYVGVDFDPTAGQHAAASSTR